MVKDGSQTIIIRDCGSRDYCDNFECKNNFYCKCRYCSDDMCNRSNKKITLDSFYLILISSFGLFYSINYM